MRVLYSPMTDQEYYKCVCECGTFFEYQLRDVHKQHYWGREQKIIYAVQCPICKKYIGVGERFVDETLDKR
jgi:hypothetical protein